MYGLTNGVNIFDLRWPLQVKGQGQTPKKLRNTFIPVYLMILGDCDSNFVFINAQQYRPMHIIHEQFTVKVHPALFKGEGES